MAAHLVDRREARLEAVARGAQIQPPHTCPFGTGQARGLLDVLVEPPGPVPERLRVVVAEALDVMHLEARTLQGERYPGQRQRLRIREHVALAERPGRRIVV